MLLDDELPGLSFLKIICQEIPSLEVVKAFNDPDIFMQEFPSMDFDLCILDIEMPKYNGLEIAELLKNKAVIFTTAYKEYALDAFNLQAIDYIQKPVQKERLEKAVAKAIRLIQPEKKRLFIKVNTSKGKSMLYFYDVIRITTSSIDSRDKIVYLKNGKDLIIKNITFDKLMLQLPKSFCRINKKDIIPIEEVEHFSLEEITLKDHPKESLQLSEVYRFDFIHKMNQF